MTCLARRRQITPSIDTSLCVGHCFVVSIARYPPIISCFRCRNLNLLCDAALLNYETVKYFCNEKLERDNFATAIGDYQVSKSRGALHSLRIRCSSQKVSRLSQIRKECQVCLSLLLAGPHVIEY